MSDSGDQQVRFELGGLSWTDAVWDVLEHDTDLVFELTGLHLLEAVGGNGVWVSGRKYKGQTLAVLRVTDKRHHRDDPGRVAATCAERRSSLILGAGQISARSGFPQPF